MTKNEIEEVVCQIMKHDGPDRHTDGSDVITDFIVALLDSESEGYVWKAQYYSQKKINY